MLGHQKAGESMDQDILANKSCEFSVLEQPNGNLRQESKVSVDNVIQKLGSCDQNPPAPVGQVLAVLRQAVLHLLPADKRSMVNKGDENWRRGRTAGRGTSGYVRVQDRRRGKADASTRPCA